ncbi:hypothetical protein CWI75_18115 [Kineobactrum sediminis]|uniref:STAS domain-containing protein n=2 Tax=Kineobactrum sediminis TaxID=1905677 RepID=A0A2N5XXS7_9GAMM|nr:hypothetical protein CWI75_18115 [Kineobactrum sediminis]
MDSTTVKADLSAGITGAVIVIPQAIAFATIAGLPLEYGFYSALIVPIIAALFGSSWHMVTGPTTAISVLVFSTISVRYAPGSAEFIQCAITLTLLTGMFQLIFGALRLGALTRLVSPSVMTGFTAGAAITIALSQIGPALGVELAVTGNLGSFSGQLQQTMSEINPFSCLLFLVAFLTTLFLHYFKPGWPVYLIALVLATVIAHAMNAQAFGVVFISPITSVIPPVSVPFLSSGVIRDLAQGALAIALVGLLEAVTIARSIAMRSGQLINVNQEFIGQGLANTIGGFFSAYASSGSFTRSGVNYDAGARSPLAAIISSLSLLLILLFGYEMISYIPRPAIAGVILMVAFRLIDLRELRRVFVTSSTASAVVLLPFVSTIFVGLDFAIYAGVLLSIGLFLRQSSLPYIAKLAPDPETEPRTFRNALSYQLNECPQLAIVRIDGQLFFGATQSLNEQLRDLEELFPQQKFLLLLLKGVSQIDFPGADLIIREAIRRRSEHGALYLTARRRQISTSLDDYAVIKAVGEENIFPGKDAAIQGIAPLLDRSVCQTCLKRVFRECKDQPGPG